MTELERKIEEIKEELIAVRRDLHRHPEIGFEERYTADKVANYLKECGYEVTEGIGGTGVIGVLYGANEGPTFALRACLDALEVPEQTGVDYASEFPGRMHACGHDGNMTVTLGAAKILAQYKDVLNGNIKVIFQPSEENTGGAAEIVAADGLKNPDVDAIITPHIWHGIPKGKICLKAGPVMASSDLFKLEVHGAAGHGAWPQLAVDPLPVAAELILSLQKIISREIDPMTPACLSIGKLEYGTAANIVSKTVTMHGTVRTFDPMARDLIQKRIDEIAYGVTKASRASYTLEYNRVMPPLSNAPELTAMAMDALTGALGESGVTSDYEASMGCEEFSVYQEHIPGLFMFIGSSEADKPIIEIHNPKFLFPEECLSIGVRALCEIALNYSKTKHSLTCNYKSVWFHVFLYTRPLHAFARLAGCTFLTACHLDGKVIKIKGYIPPLFISCQPYL